MGKRKSEEMSASAADDKDGDKSVVGDKSMVESNWDELVARLEPFALSRLAPKKLTRKLYKVIKKAQKQKQLRKGVREVQKFIRKKEKGIVILAGDTNPIDVISHMPVLCEDENILYCYVPSKTDLGAACGSRRQTCTIMIKSHAEYLDKYQECEEEIKVLRSAGIWLNKDQ